MLAGERKESEGAGGICNGTLYRRTLKVFVFVIQM